MPHLWAHLRTCRHHFAYTTGQSLEIYSVVLTSKEGWEIVCPTEIHAMLNGENIYGRKWAVTAKVCNVKDSFH